MGLSKASVYTTLSWLHRQGQRGLTAALLATLAACRASDSCPPFCIGVASPAASDGAASSCDSTCACAGACTPRVRSIKHLPMVHRVVDNVLSVGPVQRMLCCHVTVSDDNHYLLPAILGLMPQAPSFQNAVQLTNSHGNLTRSEARAPGAWTCRPAAATGARSACCRCPRR